MPLEPFLGQILPVSFNFAPRNWALCNGQILPINQNQALFSLLGTTYGGNGQTTFALPDLRNRVAISSGQGPGLAPYSLGERSGANAVTLTVGAMPTHTHAVNTAAPSGPSPVGGMPAASAAQIYGAADGASMGAAVASVGGSQAHENTQPCLAVNYVIALAGIYPSQN